MNCCCSFGVMSAWRLDRSSASSVARWSASREEEDPPVRDHGEAPREAIPRECRPRNECHHDFFKRRARLLAEAPPARNEGRPGRSEVRAALRDE